MWKGQLGSVDITEHRIPLVPEAKLVFSQPYQAGPGAREVLKKSVEDMLDKDVIEPSQREWASPVVLVPKSDGLLRFCVDYRRLDAITVKDSYPLPRIEDCLDSLRDATCFTTLDCNSGYWQIPVAEAVERIQRLHVMKVVTSSGECLSACAMLQPHSREHLVYYYQDIGGKVASCTLMTS